MKAGKPEQFLKSNFVDQAPSFSPDGRWLAYQSNESGNNEVYVRAFPAPSSGQGGQWQVSNNGGTTPRWSRNGHELMYQSGDQIMAASYTAKGDTFVADKPRVWIAKLGGTDWDLAPDGKRVVVGRQWNPPKRRSRTTRWYLLKTSSTNCAAACLSARDVTARTNLQCAAHRADADQPV